MVLSLISLILSGDATRADIASFFVMFASLLFVMFVCLPVHEAAHAFVAQLFGDDTGRLSGRISLNPFLHIDLWGTCMFLLFGFGYTIPTPVNENNFRNRKAGLACTYLAGPLSNVLMAVIAAFLAALIHVFANNDNVLILNTFFLYVSIYNLSYALFNLLPVPPLDGFRLIALILPSRFYYKILEYQRYFVWGILGVSYVIIRTGILPSATDIASVFSISLESIFANLFM